LNSNPKNIFIQNIFYLLPVIFAFFLPFGSLLLSGLIIIWGLASFFKIETGQLKNGFKNRNLQFLYIFFFLTVLSAAFSENKEEALFNIENKLSFVFIPYYFFCFKWPAELIKRCLVSFVSGCFFACLFLILRATVFYAKGNTDYFFYTLFSDFIHPSHFSLYLILAISIVIVYYPSWMKQHKALLRASNFFLLVFIVSVFLCSSKTGIISLTIVFPLLIAYRFRTYLNYKKAIVAGVLLLTLLFIAASFLGGPFERLRALTAMSSHSLDKTSVESTGVRILIWEQALNLIKSNYITGVGVGDVNDELMQAYKENGMTGAMEHHLNAHNQYLQSFLGIGIFGLLSLISITFFQMGKAFLQKHFMLFIFMLLIVFNFFVESMLQRSDGILFFSFFFCLFNLKESKDDIKV
jgi:O-antigen ligase